MLSPDEKQKSDQAESEQVIIRLVGDFPTPRRMTPLWKKHRESITGAYRRMIGDREVRLRWYHMQQCLARTPYAEPNCNPIPADPDDRAAVEAIHTRDGSDVKEGLKVLRRELIRVAPELVHSFGQTLVFWMLRLGFPCVGDPPVEGQIEELILYGAARLAPDNPLSLRSDGTWGGVEHATAKQILDFKAATDSFRPERKRGPRRANPRTLDPKLCEEMLQMAERSKSHREIVLKFWPNSLSDPKEMERRRGQVRRYIQAARFNRQRGKTPSPTPQKGGRSISR